MSKEIRACEMEMESAFRLQLTASQDSEALKFVIDKLETLGKKKAGLQKALSDAEESYPNVVSLTEVRQDIEDRVHKVTRGWAKLPAIQKRRALRRLIQKLLIGPQGLDIYYYSSAFTESVPLGELSKEKESPAKVIALAAQGTKFRDSMSDSKSSIHNCTSAGMVTPTRLERVTYCLEVSNHLPGVVISHISHLVSRFLTVTCFLWDRAGTVSLPISRPIRLTSA